MSQRKWSDAERLRRKSMRRANAEKLSALSDNEVAAKLKGTGDEFLASPAWKALRRAVIAKQGSRCACCGFTPNHPSQVNVDHVKPRRYYPELALDERNLQVLCARCNKRKGNKDTDYRENANGI